MAPGIPMWLEVLRAVAPLLAALLAAGVGAWVAHKFGRIQEGIARQQAETARAAATTARNKLKLDLFERRLAVYNTVRNAVESWTSEQNHTRKIKDSFRDAMDVSRWIFPSDVYKHLNEEVWQKMNELEALHPDGKTPQRIEQEKVKRHAIVNYLFAQSDRGLDEVFGAHLTLAD